MPFFPDSITIIRCFANAANCEIWCDEILMQFEMFTVCCSLFWCNWTTKCLFTFGSILHAVNLLSINRVVLVGFWIRMNLVSQFSICLICLFCGNYSTLTLIFLEINTFMSILITTSKWQSDTNSSLFPFQLFTNPNTIRV